LKAGEQTALATTYTRSIAMKTLLIFIALVLALPACAHESDEPRQAEFVSVAGAGVIKAEPDKAIINISSTAKEATAAQAKRKADAAYKSVLRVLKDADIPSKRIKVTRLSIQPEYQWSNNRQVYKGERVTRNLSVEIHDLEKVSGVVQALVENGVSTIDNMQTGFIDEKSLKQQAMAAAAADAKAKAKFLAEELDRDLGEAYEISEHDTSAPVFRHQQVESFARAKSASYDAPPEMFGTQDIRATVTVRFKLK